MSEPIRGWRWTAGDDRARKTATSAQWLVPALDLVFSGRLGGAICSPIAHISWGGRLCGADRPRRGQGRPKAIHSLCRRSERVGATVSPSAGGVGWPQSQGALPRLELIRRDWSHPNEDRPDLTAFLFAACPNCELFVRGTSCAGTSGHLDSLARRVRNASRTKPSPRAVGGSRRSTRTVDESGIDSANQRSASGRSFGFGAPVHPSASSGTRPAASRPWPRPQSPR